MFDEEAGKTRRVSDAAGERAVAARLRLASVLSDSSSLPALLVAAAWTIPEILGRSLCGIFLYDSARNRFTLAQQSAPPDGATAPVLPPGLILDPSVLPCLRRAMATRAPAVAARAEIAGVGNGAAALIPLVSWGRLLGCLLLAEPSKEDGFDERDLALALDLAGQVAVAVENAQLYEETLRQKEQLARQNALLAEQKTCLEALERQREDLTGMIIHDLRTPLTGILGGLEVLTGGYAGPLSDEAQEMAALALGSARTLLGMVNNLLDVGKMEVGQLVLHRSRLDLARVAQIALDQVRPLARKKRIRLERDIAPDAPAVVADEEVVRRVLVNLLGNAIPFTPADGIVTLEVRPHPGDGHGPMALVRVRDTGEGIPESEQARIFEKFGQVESRRVGRKMSTGLGLTFCKLAVEAHGGDIGVESAPGQGSTFWFTLPTRTPEEGGPAPRTPLGDVCAEVVEGAS